jgi:transglutaminase-like putative cysteine protease
MLLTIDHVTVYRYRQPVKFGEHQLMFRPRDSHDLRFVDSNLILSPPADIRWMHDVFGNSITVATFDEPAAELRLESVIVVEHYGAETVAFPIADHAATLPFSYSQEEVPDLGRTIERHYPDPDHKLDAWARRFLSENGATATNDVLLSVTRAIHEEFSYLRREASGVQTPVETLELGSGSCRDFAVLMMEALRSLGVAARFVSGYLYDAAVEGQQTGYRGSGATHAWVDAYLPGAGWVEFDPTNGISGGRNLVRVAVARDPAQALPVRGTFTGLPDDFVEMNVQVTVRAGNLL